MTSQNSVPHGAARAGAKGALSAVTATHHLPLSAAPEAYEHLQKKEQGMIKVVFNP